MTLCRRHIDQMERFGKIISRTRYDKNEIIIGEQYAEICFYNNDCEEIGRTKIDLEDVEKCAQYKWSFSNGGYIVRMKPTLLFLHRFILDCNNNEQEVDHINRDKLDNRKSNLRTCTAFENSRNKGMHRNNKSGVKGVFQRKGSNKWNAFINFNKQRINLGVYDNIEEATRVRKEAELKYFGEFVPIHND